MSWVGTNPFQNRSDVHALDRHGVVSNDGSGLRLMMSYRKHLMDTFQMVTSSLCKTVRTSLDRLPCIGILGRINALVRMSQKDRKNFPRLSQSLAHRVGLETINL